MKITKQKLTQIIKEELEDTSFGREGDYYGSDEYYGASADEDELNRTVNLWVEIFHSLQDLSDKWRPQTMEGHVYKEDLDAILAQLNGEEEY